MALDFEAAIAAVQDASAEWRDRRARESMPVIFDEANDVHPLIAEAQARLAVLQRS